MAAASRVTYHDHDKNNHRPQPIASGENSSGLHTTHPHLRDSNCEQSSHYDAHSGHGPSARMYSTAAIEMSTYSSCANLKTQFTAIASSIPSSAIFLHTAPPAIYHIVLPPFQQQHTATSSTSTRFIAHFPCAFPLTLLLQICYLTSARAQYRSDAS